MIDTNEIRQWAEKAFRGKTYDTPNEKYLGWANIIARLADELDAARAGILPEGTMIVPIDPTPEMKDAALKTPVGLSWQSDEEHTKHVTEGAGIYHAMLLASPMADQSKIKESFKGPWKLLCKRCYHFETRKEPFEGPQPCPNAVARGANFWCDCQEMKVEEIR